MSLTLANEQETNVKGPFLMTHYYIKQFGLEGTVINLTTPGAGVVVPGMCSYSSSKLAALKASEYIDMGECYFPVSLGRLRRIDRYYGISALPLLPPLASYQGNLTCRL